MLPGFKQECLDLNTMDYVGLKARLDELVLQKLGVKSRDSKTVSIMYGANWVSGARAVNTTKHLTPYLITRSTRIPLESDLVRWLTTDST